MTIPQRRSNFCKLPFLLNWASRAALKRGFFGALYPIYARGQAYWAASEGAEAAREFQKILDHAGTTIRDPTSVLAHLQLGRAYAL
jgi:hypothetical protein